MNPSARPARGPLIGGVGWLFCNGLAAHRHATLGRAGHGVEPLRMGLLTGAALLAALPAVLPRRRIRAGHRHWAG
ncbi:hypothetical protein ACIGXM_01225 [Kitasatospora sp. NPDC052896]|uniref:hypothetical protein n=1 Tax=Kitasatospora sp. NPDC052896 TaxID=3364061 RepID=UPI0037C866B2